jgi:hypothetical protein
VLGQVLALEFLKINLGFSKRVYFLPRGVWHGMHTSLDMETLHLFNGS